MPPNARDAATAGGQNVIGMIANHHYPFHSHCPHCLGKMSWIRLADRKGIGAADRREHIQ
jgi:hypothetical protein